MVGNLVVVVQRLVETALCRGIISLAPVVLRAFLAAEDEHSLPVRLHGLERLECDGLVDFCRLVPGYFPSPFVSGVVLYRPKRRIGNHGIVLLARRVVRGVVLRHVKVLCAEPGGPVRIQFVDGGFLGISADEQHAVARRGLIDGLGLVDARKLRREIGQRRWGAVLLVGDACAGAGGKVGLPVIQVDKPSERIHGILAVVHDVPCGRRDAKLHGLIHVFDNGGFALRRHASEQGVGFLSGFPNVAVLSPGLKLFLEVAAESYRIGRFGGTVAPFFGRGRLFRCGVHLIRHRHHCAGVNNMIIRGGGRRCGHVHHVADVGKMALRDGRCFRDGGSYGRLLRKKGRFPLIGKISFASRPEAQSCGFRLCGESGKFRCGGLRHRHAGRRFSCQIAANAGHGYGGACTFIGHDHGTRACGKLALCGGQGTNSEIRLSVDGVICVDDVSTGRGYGSIRMRTVLGILSSIRKSFWRDAGIEPEKVKLATLFFFGTWNL